MPAAAPDGEVTSADGTRIAWFQFGDEPRDGSTAGSRDRPPLVLVHGTTADHTTFRIVGPMFAARHRVCAVDRRGRGASSDTEPYSIEREFEDIAAVVDAVAADSGAEVDLVGHSFGGRCALGAATLTPNIRRLVVYESAPAPPGTTFEQPDVVERLRRLQAQGRRAELLRVFLTEVVGMDAPKIAEFEASPHYPARLAAAHTVVRELTTEMQTANFATIAGAVTAPVLQLVGELSAPVFQLGTRALDAVLRDGRIVTLPGQRHSAHHDAPERFVAEVEQFLGRAGE